MRCIFLFLCLYSYNALHANKTELLQIIETKNLTVDQRKSALIDLSKSFKEAETAELLIITDSLLNSKSEKIASYFNHLLYFKSILFYKLKRFEEAISILVNIKPQNDALFENTINESIGKAYLITSNYNLALSYLFKNLNYYTNINPNVENQVHTLSNIHTCYRRSKLFDKAYEYTKKCIAAAERSKNPTLLYIAYSNLGIYYLEKPNLIKADSVYNKLLPLISTLSQRAKMSFYNNYGETKRLLKQNAKAKEYIDSCYKLAIMGKDTFWIGIALVNKGNINIANNTPALAIKECSLALSYAKKFNSLVWQKNSCECLFESFEKSKDYKNALFYFKQTTIYNDSILNEKNKNEATQKDFQYKYAIKSAADSIKQIEANKVKDAQIKAQESELKQEKFVKVTLCIVVALILIFTVFIYNRFKLSQKQKTIIETQNHLLEEKQKEIIDSINYAKRIQHTLLAHHEFLKENLPQHFILFKPKDIVSGDYYWATKKNNKFYLAVCDSTGHGVPGAFMSLLNIGFLSEAINERGIEAPNEVFNFVRQKLIENISKEGQRDGFDGVLLCIDNDTNKITYAAANNSPVIIKQGGTLINLPSNRMPVGIGEKKDSFELYTIDFEKGNTLYLYTDGYADQFGGEKGKKYKYKQLNTFLISIQHLPLDEQQQILEQEFIAWKGNLEQVDDICIIGINIV